MEGNKIIITFYFITLKHIFQIIYPFYSLCIYIKKYVQ